MTDASPLLSIHVASKTFAGRRILEDVRLDVRPGELVALVGPSGCGKSTLLRMVAGLDGDFTGRIRLAGQSIRAPHPAIGLMFQEPRLLPWLRVADNVAFGAESARGARLRVLDLLRELGLEDWADALPKQLSGGMAQRVALARALFRQPSVLLLDEPFSAVDALKRVQLQDLLREVVQRHGVTVLMVTHDIDEAVYLADRIAILDAAPASVRQVIAVPLARPRDRTDTASGSIRVRVLERLQEAQVV
jgi:sulfonate transport system ATP-binding protein